jgi:hypothetical protein
LRGCKIERELVGGVPDGKEVCVHATFELRLDLNLELGRPLTGLFAHAPDGIAGEIEEKSNLQVCDIPRLDSEQVFV